jgi:hypothetical protein
MRPKILLPAFVGLAVLLACLLALLVALVAAPAAPAATTGDDVWFLVRCDFSHRSLDDPIKYPGIQGNLNDSEHDFHSHDFFGNKTTQYNSTYESMSRPGTPTTCLRPEDTAAYWFPTVSWNGTELKPNRVNFYYRAGDKDHTTVKPFPADLKMITGVVRWYCGTDDTTAGSKDPPKHCGSGQLGVRIVFPDCYNGERYNGAPDSNNHMSHMARSVLQSDGTRLCPDTHPIPVPTLTLNANFPIPNTSGRVTVSSGAVSTMHADFWNTWDQPELERLVVDCINNGTPSNPHPVECRSPTGTT